MITIHIITQAEDAANQLAQWLLKEKLVHEFVDIDYQDSFTFERQALRRVSTYKLSGRTKALLFGHIERGLKENFSGTDYILYSTPLLNMDQRNQQNLINSILKV